MKAHNYFNVCFTISGESADRELVEFSTVTRPSHLGEYNPEILPCGSQTFKGFYFPDFYLSGLHLHAVSFSFTFHWIVWTQ